MSNADFEKALRVWSEAQDAMNEVKRELKMATSPETHTGDPMTNLFRTNKLRSVADAKCEQLRAAAELPPEVFDPDLIPVVQELKRVAIEYDAIEKPGEYSKERSTKLINDARRVGMALYKMGGVNMMKTALDVYVSQENMGSLQRCFDRAFNGIGEWRC
jgi:hypothetical protein